MEAAEHFKHRVTLIKSLGPGDPYRNPATRDAMSHARDGDVEVMYAPFDYVSRQAMLAIVGITPGRASAIKAVRTAQHVLAYGGSIPDALKAAKFTGSFSSTGTRQNLVRMMDEIGLNDLFSVASTYDLFEGGAGAVHFTSALRYPVFVDGANYRGSPNMLKVPILRSMIETFLAEEATLLKHAVWLPLGPQPATALHHLVTLGVLRPEQILQGMPHPSGANSERVAAFLGTKTGSQLSRVTNAELIARNKTNLIGKINALILKSRTESAL